MLPTALLERNIAMPIKNLWVGWSHDATMMWHFCMDLAKNPCQETARRNVGDYEVGKISSTFVESSSKKLERIVQTVAYLFWNTIGWSGFEEECWVAVRFDFKF